MTEQNVDADSLADFTPEMIAHSIFTKDAKPPCSHQIITYQEGSDLTYIYEILITILLEGLEIITGGLKDVNLSEFTASHITVLKPWFHSIGFDVKVDVFSIDDKVNYNDYYCRALINDKINETLFIMKNIQNKSYHFFLNRQTMEQNKHKQHLKEIYGIFATESVIYRISFDFHASLNNESNKLL